MKSFRDLFKETTVAGDVAMTMGDKPPKVQKRVKPNEDEDEDEKVEESNPAINPFDGIFKTLIVGDEFIEVKNGL
jgi:hypothetical protein